MNRHACCDARILTEIVVLTQVLYFTEHPELVSIEISYDEKKTHEELVTEGIAIMEAAFLERTKSTLTKIKKRLKEVLQRPNHQTRQVSFPKGPTRLSLQEMGEFMFVTRVAKGSHAFEMGIHPGNIIMEKFKNA